MQWDTFRGATNAVAGHPIIAIVRQSPEHNEAMTEHQIHFREATAADRPRLVALINAAFSIETFLEGTRTDEERLTAMMAKGAILVAEESDGRLLGSVYTERRGARGYMGQLAV